MQLELDHGFLMSHKIVCNNSKPDSELVFYPVV